MLDSDRGKDWAKLPVEVPLQHVSYYCNGDSDLRHMKAYKAWLPLVTAYLTSSPAGFLPAMAADLTFDLINFADRNMFPTKENLEVLLGMKSRSESIRSRTKIRDLLGRQLQRLQRLDQEELKAYMKNAGNLRKLLLDAEIRSTTSRRKDLTSEEAVVDYIMEELKNGSWAWMSDTAEDDDPSTGTMKRSVTALQHERLLLLAVTALRSGDDAELYAFLKKTDISAENECTTWPEVLQPERLLSGLTLQYFGDRSLNHCAAGVLACMKHARSAVLRNSEDIAIYVMDIWKDIADRAMEKWRPYVSEAQDDGAAMRARLAHEVFLSKRHEGLNLVERKVLYETDVQLPVAIAIESHARHRVIAALRVQNVSEEIAAAYYEHVESKLHEMQKHRKNLLQAFDIGSSSSPCTSSRLIFAGCAELPGKYGLSSVDYFMYATMRKTDLLSLVVLYIEHTYHGQNESQFLDDDARFWKGLHSWHQKYANMKRDYTACGQLMLRGNLRRCSIVYNCPRCGSSSTEYRDRQTQAADEQHTYDILCNSCGNVFEPKELK